MDRRLFVTGLLGVAATAGFAAALPRQALALPSLPLGGPISGSDTILPGQPESGAQLAQMDEDWGLDEGDGEDQGFQSAYHRPRRRRRRRRMRRWHRVCRRWREFGHWRRRCRRHPHWVSIWFSI